MSDSDLERAIEQLRRMTFARSSGRAWYEIQAKAESRKATLRIYDDIGWMGTSARTFGEELAALDVDEIDLRLNSLGGNAWDGIAIYNSLRRHPAKVTVTVDGMAASAASIVAMAGERIRMSRGSQMMVHDASGVAIGNAAAMKKMTEVLDKSSDSMADIYAARTGISAEQWREVMREESWYRATEAVEAGLADEVVDDAPAPTARSTFDLSAYAYAYAGRDAAPAPRVPARPTTVPQPPVTAAEAARRIHAAATRTKAPDADPAAGPSTTTKGAAEMQFTDEERTELRARYGLAADAGDDAIKAALLAPPVARTNPTPDPDPEPDPKPTPTPTPPQAAGTMTIDVTAWQEQQARLQRLEAQAARQREQERDQIIAQAVADGKFTPARKEHWARLWDADPEGTRQVIEGLAKNVVPVAEFGYGLDGEGSEFDDEFRHFFPPQPARKGN